MLKKANDSLKVVHVIVNSINSIIEHTKGKIKSSVAGLEIIGVLTKKIIETIATKKQKKNTKTKS